MTDVEPYDAKDMAEDVEAVVRALEHLDIAQGRCRSCGGPNIRRSLTGKLENLRAYAYCDECVRCPPGYVTMGEEWAYKHAWRMLTDDEYAREHELRRATVMLADAFASVLRRLQEDGMYVEPLPERRRRS